MKREERTEGPPVAGALELHFSPRVLVSSRLETAEGNLHETGSKGREVRWQQGAMAVSILIVYTKLRALESAESETPVLEGERGSPARSIDNLLTKPGDWALNMFGERQQMPLIRDYIYRKKTVSKSNPISAVQWDASTLPPDRLRIWREGIELTKAEELRELLRALFEEFNPRRAEKEWHNLFPEGVPGEVAEVSAARSPSGRDGHHDGGNGHRPWLLLLLLFAGSAIGFFFLGRSLGPVPPVEVPATGSADVVAHFIELLNARAYEEAYALTTAEYRTEVTFAGFLVALGDQRFNFPRIAGNPYRNRVDQRVHEYRVTLYVETVVRRIPPLDDLARLPVTEMEAYAVGIQQLMEQLRELGVDPGLLRQLRKERLERPDASRYLQLVTGISDAELAKIYPEWVTVTLDLTFFFELVRDPDPDGTWRIHTVADAADRLVTF